MRFCKKCKSIMEIEKDDFFRCPKCGHAEKGKDLITEEKIPQKPEQGKGVVPDKNPNATYPNKCEKCGYGLAEIIERMPEYSDEDTFVYLRCGKCGWTQQLSRKTK